jgi:phosphopantothenoylcysteine decarboxylase/phosphopantothenate--cysteine ligase
MLAGKHIVVGISGGIAAYKTPLLIRLLRKAGAEVKVTTTANALQFVTDLTLQTLSGNKVYSDVFAPTNDHSTEHISLPDWADLMIVAPATANVIGKMANGIADDALTTTFLAMQRPVLIAPAMNDKMYAHPALQHNLETLCSFPNVTVLPCAEGFLACGTTGTGRMLEPEEIFLAAERLMTEQTMTGQHVLITAGPTQEKLDPVRFISNYSTGKMGIALAEEAALRGAEVTLVLGPTALRPRKLPNLHIVDVTSALEMCDAAVQAFPKANIAILCAAVADYRPANPSDTKIKRGAPQDNFQLSTFHAKRSSAGKNFQLVENPDIAATLGGMKREDQTLVGFALETNDEETNALKKLEKKHLDMIVLNSLRHEGAAFGCDTNIVTIFRKNGERIDLPKMPKTDVAKHILDLI